MQIKLFFFNLPVMSFRVKYKNSSAILTAENGIQSGFRGRLLTLCFLNDQTCFFRIQSIIVTLIMCICSWNRNIRFDNPVLLDFHRPNAMNYISPHLPVTVYTPGVVAFHNYSSFAGPHHRGTTQRLGIIVQSEGIDERNFCHLANN